MSPTVDSHTTNGHAVEVRGLRRGFGSREAVRDLNLKVRRGECHGFFGRNGAGKTTTIKCLLNHLRPEQGSVRVFGKDPQVDEVAVKAHIGYVPDEVAFYPWMTVRRLLDYTRSFRRHWNDELERELLDERFDLDETARVESLSRGMKGQLALVCAVCPEPDLLVLDEPTSGLDPVVRREFLETVIGAYQESAPGERAILVSTHLIDEFEGLVESFTLIEAGRDTLSMTCEQAGRAFKKVRLLFDGEPPAVGEPEVLREDRQGRELELLVRDFSQDLEHRLKQLGARELLTSSVPLEEIVVALARQGRQR